MSSSEQDPTRGRGSPDVPEHASGAADGLVGPHRDPGEAAWPDGAVPMAEEALPAGIESELENMLREAEAAAAKLRRELAEQRLARRQHDEVERLEEHLVQARARWEEIRDFFEEALGELRGDSADGRSDRVAGNRD